MCRTKFFFSFDSLSVEGFLYPMMACLLIHAAHHWNTLDNFTVSCTSLLLPYQLQLIPRIHGYHCRFEILHSASQILQSLCFSLSFASCCYAGFASLCHKSITFKLRDLIVSIVASMCLDTAFSTI